MNIYVWLGIEDRWAPLFRCSDEEQREHWRELLRLAGYCTAANKGVAR
jgi:hypothetical protein